MPEDTLEGETEEEYFRRNSRLTNEQADKEIRKRQEYLAENSALKQKLEAALAFINE